jgi:hypothetical protein
MSDAKGQGLLEALLDSGDRNTTILVNHSPLTWGV